MSVLQQRWRFNSLTRRAPAGLASRSRHTLASLAPPPARPFERLPVVERTFPATHDDPAGLQSTWAHRAWVGGGCAALLVSLTKSLAGSVEAHLLAEPLFAAFIGYLLADLGSGVYHWGVDNYGDGETPVFGTQIAAFRGHHRWPWTITRRQFANNLQALARAVGAAVLPFDVLSDDPVVHAFVAACGGCIMFSQQFHAWAHGTRSRLPTAVVALQEAGVLVSRAAHAAHHRPPYNGNYCIVSGAWNRVLDENRVFEAAEMVIFFRFGVRPRSWAEPKGEWTEEAETPAADDDLLDRSRQRTTEKSHSL